MDGRKTQLRALVVEDDASISDVVCSTLDGAGFLCTPAYSGTEARLLIEQGESFDLVICDLMLPGIPGEELVSLIRAKSAVPILVTSAKAQVVDRVALLRMGADDYLVKPFDLDELVARAEALVRRSGGFAGGEGDADGSSLTYGEWILYEDARRFEAAGRLIGLTRTEFDIVASLMRHPRKVFTKRELYRAVWNEDAAVEEKAISTHVSNIRAKLKGTGTDGYIETVWGIGFKLADLSA
ncbi:MAG TPA: response regulator transcription factor [Candidatus Aphodovivens excrementavium]|nr:response regulator transcription factor [Candidatus Aphodovivens excrementavium]